MPPAPATPARRAAAGFVPRRFQPQGVSRMNILDPAQFVDMALYGRAVFQGPGDGSGVQALQADDADGTNAEPVPDGPTARPVGANWELVLDSVQMKKRFAGVAGASGAVGQV